MLTGRVDDFGNGIISGWAYNDQEPDEHLIIRVMQGKQVIATGVANIMRRDLPDSGIGDGDHAFRIPAPQNITSFHGLMIIAQSVDAGEVPLPIATNDDRLLDKMFAGFAGQYEGLLVEIKEGFEELSERMDALESGRAAGAGDIPADLAQKLQKLEKRLDSAEVFLVRIDEALRPLLEKNRKKSRKKFLGLF